MLPILLCAGIYQLQTQFCQSITISIKNNSVWSLRQVRTHIHTKKYIEYTNTLYQFIHCVGEVKCCAANWTKKNRFENLCGHAILLIKIENFVIINENIVWNAFYFFPWNFRRWLKKMRDESLTELSFILSHSFCLNVCFFSLADFNFSSITSCEIGHCIHCTLGCIVIMKAVCLVCILYNV